MGQYDSIYADLDAATAAVASAHSKLQAMDTPANAPISTPAALDAAIAAAKPNDVLTLATSFVYDKELTISLPLTLTSAQTVTGRAAPGAQMPTFPLGINLPVGGSLMGLSCLRANLNDVLVLGGDCILDGNLIAGDATNGGKRGINANDVKSCIANRNYVYRIFRVGQDTQAFYTSNGVGPFTLHDNTFIAATETILFGGDTAVNVPSGISITNNLVTKDPAWQGTGIQVKNCLELKSAKNVSVSNNEFAFAWGGFTQDGYLLVLTPRNQDGSFPGATVDTVDIFDNTFHDGAAFVQMLGSDYTYPSGPLQNVKIHNNSVSVDPVKYAGSVDAANVAKMIYVQSKGGFPKGLLIDSNVCATASQLPSAVYLDSNDGSLMGLTITNNKFPASWYGLMGASCSPSDVNGNGANGQPNPTGAWNMYVSGGTLSGNTIV